MNKVHTVGAYPTRNHNFQLLSRNMICYFCELHELRSLERNFHSQCLSQASLWHGMNWVSTRLAVSQQSKLDFAPSYHDRSRWPVSLSKYTVKTLSTVRCSTEWGVRGKRSEPRAPNVVFFSAEWGVRGSLRSPRVLNVMFFLLYLAV